VFHLAFLYRPFWPLEVSSFDWGSFFVIAKLLQCSTGEVVMVVSQLVQAQALALQSVDEPGVVELQNAAAVAVASELLQAGVVVVVAVGPE
jgi:hypothetical protein